jgi:hypothetical protein
MAAATTLRPRSLRWVATRVVSGNKLGMQAATVLHQVSSLQQELSAEQALRNGLESKVNELETENKGLKEVIDHHKAVTDCVLPFVRDYHAVAIRTLLDAVLYNLKWDGQSGREDFVRLRQRAVEALFNFLFSAGEIGQIMR